MLEQLKKEVYEANMDLVAKGMVIYTWGNVSGIDREKGLVVIKPSGVDYATMTWEDMVVVDMEGNVVEGKYKPSSDTPTHLVIYKAFPETGGVVHTHSTYGVTFAQAGLDIPAFGTTHADYFYGDIPCTRDLTEQEIEEAYERNTGLVIAETFRARGIDPLAVPAVLVKSHGPFTWGKTPEKAVENALVLDECAHMALLTRLFDPSAAPAAQCIQDKHYFRKHGANAYYGQK